MIEQLQEQIKVVVRARAIAKDFIDAKNRSLAKWEEDNKSVIQAVVDVGVRLGEVEGRLRELTLQAYAETGNKAPAKGVGIREVTKLEYDTKTAFDWAIEHSMALSLDKRGFEKIAKVSPPDFVTISQQPQATIATNLEEKDEG